MRSEFSGGAGGAAAGPADLGEPTGWATLKGKITVVGAPPQPQALTITADAGVCAPGGKTVFSEKVVVGPGGGLKNAIVYLATEIPDDETWINPTARIQPGEEQVLFDQKECVFLSHMLGLQAGQTLLVKNSDPVGHNTKIESKSNRPENFSVGAGATTTWETTQGERAPFAVSCAIHPWMLAHMMVTPTGYFAVTNENGEFTIPNLPAGVELEFRVWHEAAGQRISDSASGVSRGKFKLKLEGDKDLPIQVDAGLL
jgi:hypothetical protein